MPRLPFATRWSQSQIDTGHAQAKENRPPWAVFLVASVMHRAILVDPCALTQLFGGQSTIRRAGSYARRHGSHRPFSFLGHFSPCVKSVTLAVSGYLLESRTETIPARSRRRKFVSGAEAPGKSSFFVDRL
jgi:hypothetical protein